MGWNEQSLKFYTLYYDNCAIAFYEYALIMLIPTRSLMRKSYSHILVKLGI